jgi:hypothetical protein
LDGVNVGDGVTVKVGLGEIDGVGVGVIGWHSQKRNVTCE